MKKLLSILMIGFGFSCSAMDKTKNAFKDCSVLNFPLEKMVEKILATKDHCYKKILPRDISILLGKYCLRKHPVTGYLESRWVSGCLGTDTTYVQNLDWCWCDDGRKMVQVQVDPKVYKGSERGELAHFNKGRTRFVICNQLGNGANIWGTVRVPPHPMTVSDLWIKRFEYVALNDTGNRLVAKCCGGVESREGRIFLWNLDTGTSVQIEADGFDMVGDTLVTWNRDGRICRRNSETGTLEKEWDAGQETLSVQVSPKKNFLVTFHSDSVPRLWNAHTGDLLKTLEPCNGLWVEFYPLGDQLMILDNDKLKVWDTVTDQWLKPLELGDSLGVIAQFNPAGDKLMTCTRSFAKLWDVSDVSNVECIKTIKGNFHPSLFWREKVLPLAPSVCILRQCRRSTSQNSRLFDDIFGVKFDHEIFRNITLDQAVILIALYDMQIVRDKVRTLVRDKMPKSITQDGIPYINEYDIDYNYILETNPPRYRLEYRDSQSILFDFGKYPPHVQEIFESLPPWVKEQMRHLVMPASMSEALSTADIARFNVLLKNVENKVVLLEKLVRGLVGAPKDKEDLFLKKIDACVGPVNHSVNKPSPAMGKFFNDYAANKQYQWPVSFTVFAHSCKTAPQPPPPRDQNGNSDNNSNNKSSFVLQACMGVAAIAFIGWLLKKNSQKNEDDEKKELPSNIDCGDVLNRVAV